MNRIVFAALMLLVVISPLPLGANRAWAWSLCAGISALLALAWAVANMARSSPPARMPNPPTVIACLLVCAWMLVQQADGVPAAWMHPLWTMTAEVLEQPRPGTISLGPGDTSMALMRMLSYALVFLLAFQLGHERTRAQAAFGWLVMAGLAYALFGLLTYWGGYHPGWLFGDKVLPADVRSTFVNRNHFATWQGLTLLVAMAYFYQRLSRPVVKPYAMAQDREARVEEFILRAWKPLAALLLMTAALVLTHSRGGFTATLVGTVVLLYLLDRRARRHRATSRVVVIAALAVVSLAFYLTSEVLLDRINRTDITAEERLAVFADVNRGIADNPVLGYGYGTFADSFRLYNQVGTAVHYDRAHNTWLENAFELGLPAALALYLALAGLAITCLRGVKRRHRDWVYPATGVAASVLVGLHATVDFSAQLPAVAILYACIMGIACAQSRPSTGHGALGVNYAVE
jgi:O-antigen ligase